MLVHPELCNLGAACVPQPPTASQTSQIPSLLGLTITGQPAPVFQHSGQGDKQTVITGTQPTSGSAQRQAESQPHGGSDGHISPSSEQPAADEENSADSGGSLPKQIETETVPECMDEDFLSRMTQMLCPGSSVPCAADLPDQFTIIPTHKENAHYLWAIALTPDYVSTGDDKDSGSICLIQHS